MQANETKLENWKQNLQFDNEWDTSFSRFSFFISVEWGKKIELIIRPVPKKTNRGRLS